mgnify:CR=1 FL=1
MIRQVQRANSQHGTHDVVAGEPELHHVVSPEGPEARVCRQGGVGAGGEVVEEFKLEGW